MEKGLRLIKLFLLFFYQNGFNVLFFVAGTEVAAPVFRLTLEGHLGKVQKF
jgi:hypothetical protein